MTAVVSDHWQDEWLRANWDATPETIEYAFGLGLISMRQYFAATREQFIAELDRKLIDWVADTLSIDETLTVIRCRSAA